MHHPKFSLLVLFVFLLITQSGCLLSQRQVFLDYNKETDEMRVLQIYTGIQNGHGEIEENAAYLALVYQHRDRVYHDLPAPFGTNHGMDLTLAKNPEDEKFYPHFLGVPDNDDIDVNVNAFNDPKIQALITTRPGTFYTLKQSPLNYYAETRYKGDAFTAKVNMNFSQYKSDLVSDVDNAIRNREKNQSMISLETWVDQMIVNEKIMWEMLPPEAAGGHTNQPAKKYNRYSDVPALYRTLDMASLKKLKQWFSSANCRFTREKLNFTIDIPLSKEDQAGALKELPRLFKAFKEIRAHHAKQNKKVPFNLETSLAQLYIWLMDFTVSKSEKGILLTIDTTPGYQLFTLKPPVGPYDQINQLAPTTRENYESSVDMARQMHGQKIKPVTGISNEQLIKDFYAGKLKSYLPKKASTQPAE